ncbi:MAG: FAD-binding protein, partial [Lachnospiraceae bacterium]|nr:FAD-binding protein [Lachnospiraceae bacterium]
GWNADLRAQYSPDCADAWPVTSPGNTGDGLLMAMEVGADTVFKGGFIGWKVVSPAYGHTTAIGGPIYGAANLIVNETGDRFANESLDYPFLYADMQKDGSDTFYFIFDSGASETKDLVENVSNTVANLELAVAAGVCYKADTLEELAQISGLTNLVASTEQYNGAIASGTDEAFGRDTSTMIAIENGPYYALQCQKAILGTFGGLNTNIAGEVVDAEGNAIPGLYAAGEVANGEFFPVLYPASGSSLSMCVVLGREAGISAAAYAASK